MAILHVLSNPEAAESCLSAACDGDAVLLVGDGAFAHGIAQRPGIRFGVLEEDLASRSLQPSVALEALTYAEFVEWVAECSKSVTWR
ncbi:MAG: DsrH/TusB family sulfur metabolism protein [Gammaproteobacteria bacterium]|nr:DsrH/TusB family sulfur metabolism protein [Gammaproteobacteria bacterium]